MPESPDSAKTVFSSAERRTLLEERLRATPKSPPGGPRGGEPAATAPLSFAQERLWFLEQLEPGSAAYHVARAFRLSGRLCPRSLAAGLSALVARHGALRSVLEPGARQRLLPARPVAVPVIDLAPLDSSCRAVAALAAAEARRPFALASEPLLRATRLLVAPEESVLLLTLHHLATDAASMAILYRELSSTYRAFVRGEVAALPPLATDYASFARDERRRLSSPALAGLAAWWSAELAGAPLVLELPTDRLRPSVASLCGRGFSRPLPPGTSARLLALAAELQATPFALLLAVFAAWVRRVTGQGDLLVGTPVANRPRRELEGVVGLFVNTVVLRLEAGGDPRFDELAARCWRTTGRALSHQELPFERLVEALAPPRDLARSAVFQLLFLWQSEETGELALPGLEVEPLAFGRAESKFDLSLAVVEAGAGLSLHAQYAADLFDATHIVRLLGELETLLAAGLENSSRRLSQLPLLSPTARHQLLLEWNDTVEEEGGAPGESSGGLAALCLAPAARVPDAVAVATRDEALSCGELERRVRGLAAWLLADGLAPEEPVGVALPRGPDFAVAALATVAAGGLYLPLDSALPAARRSAMLAAAGARRVLSSPLPAAGREAGLLPEIMPEQGAYLIFTSGSTGRPKGVLVSHRAIANRVLWGERRYPLLAADRVMQSAGVGFDFSVWELLAPLAAGARLLFPSPAAEEDLGELASDLAALRATVAHFVPSLLAAVLDTGRLAEADGLRLVFSGGEALPEALARRFEAASPAELWNQYGPTEATVDATYWPRRGRPEGSYIGVPAVSGEVPAVSGVVPIGRPIANLGALVVDSFGRPCPQGVPGELWLWGVGLARGYLGQPGQTALRFVPDAFSGRPGERCYQTGDRVRTGADGRLEFQGRLDHQVKLRGIRIELGEIEAALASHPQVASAAVLLQEPPGAERRLVAYVAGTPPPDSRALAAYLAERLPAAMVPSRFVTLATLPVTAAGKLDRRALAEIELAAAAEQAWEPPRGEVEELLAGLWSELLGVARPGRRARFFEHGGHSLVALRLATRVRQLCGVALPLKTVFEQPELAALAGCIGELLAAGEAREAPESWARVPREGVLVPSFAQERIWFLAQLPGGSRGYNLPLRFRLAGDLEIRAMGQAFAALGARHESLRTGFGAGGEPRLDDSARCLLAVLDLAALADPAAVAERLAAAEATAAFALDRAPLLRARLLRLAPGEALLLATLHHIVGDGWSVGVLCRDLSALYAAARLGRAPVLPALTLEGLDHAAWQRRRFTAERLAAPLGWWRQQLAGAPRVLDLPTDRPRPAVATLSGARFTNRLAPRLAAALGATARRLGATPFMLHLAAFSALLARLSGQRQVVIGTAVAGREGRESEDLLGCFVNTLALPLAVAREAGSAALVAATRERVLASFAHQDLPFERLVEALVTRRDPAHHPLFQVFFTWSQSAAATLDLPGVAVERQPAFSASSKFDLSLSLFDTGRDLLATFEHSTDLFDATTVRRWAAQLERLLAALAADAEDLDALPLTSPAERAQLLTEWSDTRSAPPRGAERSLVDGWLAQARARPEAVAVVDGHARLSYAALAARAEALAARLAQLGVGPEVRVGVSLPRSADLLVALLAVERSGGAYVPLDPAYPEDRLAFMVEDSQALAVVAGAKEWSRLPLDTLDRPPLWVQPYEVGAGRIESLPERDQLAYLIYTSGSTGRPKAVAIEHRSAVAMVRWARATFPAAAFEAVLWATSIAFDLSIFEIFVTLTVGGRLLVAENALALPSLPAAGETTLINTVPSAMGELVQLGAVPPSVRVVNLAGEPLPGSLARRVYALPQRLELWNLYGPSEDTTYSTGCRVPPGRPAKGGSGEPTIGRPLADTRALVLGRRFELQPLGVPGELWLAGAGLARGYLGRPALTAERFMAHPQAERPGERAYRTGDLVRWLPAGELQFLGRLDHQVKIRGFRVELGEVETALLAHSAVREAVVLARRDDEGPARLVAYVSGEEGKGLDLPGLKAALGSALPEYMVPAAFVVLPALPRLPNGKVDRKSLPAPLPPGATDDYQPPGSELEELLASVWCELLKLDRVGVKDDFFALGGHSLLAGRAIARLRPLLGVEVPMALFFEHPMLGELALALSALQAGAVDRAELSWERAEPLPATFTQQTLWMFSELDRESPALNLVGTFRLLGQLVPAALSFALTRVVDRHEALRTGFVLDDGRLLQEVAPPSKLTIPLVDLSALAPGPAAFLAKALTERSALEIFALSRPPLVRMRLVRLPPGADGGESEHRLAAAIHHIVADGWSLGIFIAELSEAYAARVEGRPERLAPLPFQFAEFASWQRRALSPPRIEGLLATWTEHLAGAELDLDGLGDRPRPLVSRHQGEVVRVELSPELVLGLRRFCRRRGVTLYMTLLAAYAWTLARRGGRRRVLVGAPVAGRNRAELERLIGLFINLVTLDLRLPAGATLAEWAGAVKDEVLWAFAHQEMPFEVLAAKLAPRGGHAKHPLFQTLFVLQNIPRSEWVLPGVELTALATRKRGATMDLALHMLESGEGLHGGLAYDCELFDPSTAVRLVRELQAALLALAADAETRLEAISLLAPAERHQLVHEWSGAVQGVDAASGLLDRQVRQGWGRHPEAIAVAEGEERWSYQALDAASAAVGAALAARGAGAEARVGVHLERSFAQMAVLLGALRAGVAVVPFDARAPEERIEAVLADAQAVALVTRSAALGSRLRGRLAWLEPDVALARRKRSARWQEPPRDPAQVALVIYTSGSTGKPKGVMVAHRALAAYAAGAVVAFGLGPGDRLLQFASASFDTSAEEIYPTWSAGATLVLRDEEMLASVAAFVEACERLRLTVLDLPTAWWQQWVAEGGALPSALRLVILGGERAQLPRAVQWLANAAAPRTLNTYGPTEATVVATSWSLPSRPWSEADPAEVPIGRPVVGARAWVLDRAGRLVPRGLPGELAIGGSGLARGYLGDPARTARLFVPNPFATLPGERLYRSGDRVRHLPTGDLEFLGRIDRQLKVRGFRVEPAEIEATLVAHPEIAAAVVVPWAVAGQAADRLAAYLVATAGSALDLEALRAWLRQRLPEYLVPAALLPLAELPLSTSGKVDVKRLPPPEATARQQTRTAPQTDVERFVAEHWRAVLKLPTVALEDDFFASGGHSLLATQLIARIEQESGLRMSLRSLFDAPILGEFARRVEERLVGEE